MVPRSPQSAGDMGSNGNARYNSRPAVSSPKPPSSRPRAHVEISFVAGVSKESRKAVRVQAAKASAAARKATIARRSTAQKRDTVVVEDVRVPATCVSKSAKPTPHRNNAKTATLCPPAIQQKPVIATLELPQHKSQLVQSPSEASSQSLTTASNNGIEIPKILGVGPPVERPARPALSRSRLRTSPQPCSCVQCGQINSISYTGDPRLHLEPTKNGTCNQLDNMRAATHCSPPITNRISVIPHNLSRYYPVQRQPWYDGVMTYMTTVFAPRAWPVLKITPPEGVEWEQFMTQHAMVEPAFFYVRLLFGTGDLVRIGALGSDCSCYLQSLTIKAINEALSEDKRYISDGLILAVGRIALHECMYGDRTAANTIHRPAQKRMIDLRGGMKNLKFPRLVKRLMRWSDTMMAMQGNTQRLLPDEEVQGGEAFGVKQSVDIFEAWAPERGQALRKKIALSIY